MKRPGKWNSLVLLFASLAALVGTAMPASADTGVDGFPVLVAHNQQQAHVCSVIGSADGYEAVVCADILTDSVSSSEYRDWGRVEVICETTSTHVEVQCAQVDAWGQLWSGAGEIGPTAAFVCGHQFGACSATRNYTSSTTTEYSTSSASACKSNPDSYDQQWMIVTSNTAVELPVSGTWVEAGTNRSSGHYYICP